MENITLNKVEASSDAKIVEKNPKHVADFLRNEYNFGDPKETDRAVVERFIDYIEERGNERLLMNEPSWANIIVEELEKAGFAEPGKISHKEWTPEADQALGAVLESLD